ncbi:MAG: PEP-CTERM sorting domain-containing protein [Candidatus Rokuibacteriota bacterium]
MRVTLVLLAGALCLTLTAGEAFGMAWGESRHRRGNGSTGSSGSGYTASVPEPSSLYAIGSALALLGGAGWILRRK